MKHLALALALAATTSAVPVTAAVITFDEFAADNANGNPGNWGVDGTNGPIFSGFNGDSYSQTLTFASNISGFSLDGTITLQGFLGATLVATNVVNLGAINTWSTLSIAGTFDRVVYSGTGQDFHPFGVDNLRWDQGIPEPATWAMMIGGLGLVGAAVRRRPQGAVSV